MFVEIDFENLFLHVKGLTHSPFIHIFFWLMILDICTGYYKAFKTKQFDSKTGTMGLLRHMLVFATIVIVATYARALHMQWFGQSWCTFFIINYVGSLIENWEVIGIGFPEWLKPYINQMKKANDNQFAQALKGGGYDETSNNAEESINHD